MSKLTPPSTLQYTTASGRTVTLPINNTVLIRRVEPEYPHRETRDSCSVCKGDGEIVTTEGFIEPCWHCGGNGDEPVDA